MSAETARVAAAEPYDREKRVLLTRSQEHCLAELLRKLEQATGGLLITGSEITRGLLTLAFQVEPEILRSAASACGRVSVHPATADTRGKELLESRLAAIVFDAVRHAQPLRPR